MNIFETLSHQDALVFAWAIISIVATFLFAGVVTLGAAWLFDDKEVLESFKNDIKG